MHVTQEQHPGVFVHVRFKINLQPRTALGFPRQRESQLRSGLRRDIRRRLPEVGALKRHRVMQPHHQRRVDVVRRAVEAIRQLHAGVARLLLPLAPEVARKNQKR